MADQGTGTAAAGQAAATPPATGAPTAGTASGTASDWTGGFSDEMKGFVQNKGWKNAQEVADSYRNLEKLQGVPQDRILKLPESMESDEAQAIWTRLGKPKEAKEYNLQVPEKGGDPKLAEWASDVFHKSNLTAKQAADVMKAWNERQAATQTQTLENQKISLNQATERLKTEWGAAYEKNMNLAKSGMAALELDAATIDTLANIQGADKLFKTLSKIGQGVGEASFVSGRPAGDGTVTPDQARSQLNDLYRDAAWVKRYTSGDFDAKRQMEHLMKMANPGEMRLT